MIPVANESKIRKASVERINDLLDRNALKYRRGVMPEIARLLHESRLKYWRHGYSASSLGTEMTGSRLQWEVQQWAYPVPREGEAQKQDPDDHTADDSDAIAADRYALMSWWRAVHVEEPEPEPEPNYDTGLDRLMELLNNERERY